jgi:Helix-turn-helix domain
VNVKYRIKVDVGKGVHMSVIFEERSSESSVVESVWRMQSDQAGNYISIASSHWSLLLIKDCDEPRIKMFGPETKATPGDFNANAEVLGINFKPGTFMPHLPPGKLVNDNLKLLEASSQSFWLKGSAWQFPTYDDADTFATWLLRDGIVVRDPVVAAVLRGDVPSVSPRSLQYRFLGVTGLTQRTILQIHRAKCAAALLARGVSIPDTVHEAGYCDQPHLTRSLKHLMGQTPAQLVPVSTAK